MREMAEHYRTYHSIYTTSTASIALLFLTSAPAAADQPADAPAAPSEIIVTATRHSGTVQTIPASIAAVGGVALQERGIASFASLAQGTPGVSLKSEGPSQTEIEMRGMTSSGGNSATVGFYLDDTPLSGSTSAQNGHVIIDPTLYDLNRVEMLRGPQGTLYGAGSMGGTVRLITNQPDPGGFHASAQTTLSGTDGGGFNHADNLMVNIPIVSDKIALRVVGSENFTSGWIDRIVVAPGDFPLVSANGSTRGDVAAAPVAASYPHSNAYQIYSVRAKLLIKPTDQLTIEPAVFYETSHQNGISAYDSVPGNGETRYQPFDIPEPLNDRIEVYSLGLTYDLDTIEISSSTAQWYRRSTQQQDASEDFNNPLTGVTLYANGVNTPCGAAQPSYYGACGTGAVYGVENDPTRQFSEELRVSSKGKRRFSWVAGAYYTHLWSLWSFNRPTSNPSAFMDLGTFEPATTPNFFDAYSPTSENTYALFGDATYAITPQLKAEVGLRWTHYTYNFSSCISGWGSGMGAAEPSCSGLIHLVSSTATPKFNLSWEANRDVLVYATVAEGFRPGGGNNVYPTTGAAWAPAFAAYNYTGGQWPSTYAPDRVWSYELGEKATLLDRRLTLDVSVYYEDWTHIQLEAYPDNWALNINGNYAHIYGGEAALAFAAGGGFDLSATLGTLHQVVSGGPHWVITPNNLLPDVAPVVGDAVAAWAHPVGDNLTFKAHAELSYTGQRYSLAFPYGNSVLGEYIRMSPYALVSVRAGIESGAGWSATLFVNNLTNKHAALESLFQELLPSAAFNRIVTNQPLTAGLDLAFRF
jgi:iron complex outermembrane recepter protein